MKTALVALLLLSGSVSAMAGAGLVTGTLSGVGGTGGGGAPTGPAGGVLTGTYPNPTLALVSSNTIYASPDGNDTNNGLSALSPKLTFDGINAINRPGRTIYFAAGVYPIVTNALELTNSVVIAWGAVHSTGTNATDIIDFYPGTNAIYGGSWIYTNKVALAANFGNASYPWQWAPIYYVNQNYNAGTNSFTMVGTKCLGYFDVLYLYGPDPKRVDLRGNWFESFDDDATQIQADGTNSTFNCVGNTFVTHGGASGIARNIALTTISAYFTGNNFFAYDGINDTVAVEANGSTVFLSGNTIQVYSSNYVSSTSYPSPMYIEGVADGTAGNQLGGNNKWSISGHPYPDNLMAFDGTDIVSFVGWGNTNGQQVSTNFIGTLTVTNNPIFGNATNTATGTLIQTNFISGKLYTNIYGRPILLSVNATLTTTGVAGNASLSLLASSYLTNAFSVGTLVTSIAMPYTNVLSMVIPANQQYTFTNTSIGLNNTSAVLGGQILVY